jgi:hypothetical protein
MSFLLYQEITDIDIEISTEMQKRIFIPFLHVDISGKRRYAVQVLDLSL